MVPCEVGSVTMQGRYVSGGHAREGNGDAMYGS